MDLELALERLFILVINMYENFFFHIYVDILRDINSIIHSNKFEYHDHDRIYVYSQKGKEPVDLNNLLRFARSIL